LAVAELIMLVWLLAVAMVVGVAVMAWFGWCGDGGGGLVALVFGVRVGGVAAAVVVAVGGRLVSGLG
jgi:hypothetical protein